MKQYLLVLVTLLFLVACNDTEVNNNPIVTPPAPQSDNEQVTNTENPTDNEIDQENSNSIDFKRYFKPDGSTAYYLGEGNEFATYTEKTIYLSSEYVATIIDNGGATTMKIYRILDDRIELIANDVIDVLPETQEFPNVQDLDDLEAIETYLTGPLKVGTTFGKWTIVETNITLETPVNTFENVFVLEEQGEDYLNRKYFVEDYGVIKEEFIMQIENEDEFVVTSTLKNIEK